MTEESMINEEIVNSLIIAKHFLNRRTYRILKSACMVMLPEEMYSRIRRHNRLKSKYTVYDFINAMSMLNIFVKRGTSIPEKAMLNSKGLHSQTILEIMNILLKHSDYESMEDICYMIDEDDANAEAKSIRKTLLTTRNNMMPRKEDLKINSALASN